MDVAFTDEAGKVKKKIIKNNNNNDNNKTGVNSPFPSCCAPHYDREANCKVFIMKISFYSYANKSNFHLALFS